MGLTSIVVRGEFVLADTSVPEGQVAFMLTAEMHNAGSSRVVPRVPIVVPLVGGAFSVTLYATDDADTEPPSVRYSVTERFVGADGSTTERDYLLTVPHTAPAGVLDLSTVG